VSTAHQVGQAGRFNVTVRPARAAYLIASGSRTGFQSAVQEATVRWGGACEPIIEMPEDGTVSEQSRAIITAADVDALVNIDAPKAPARALADSLGMHLVPVTNIRAWGTSLSILGAPDLSLMPWTPGTRSVGGFGYPAGWNAGGMVMSAFFASSSICRSSVDMIGM
jgi:hypothetical protein